jgi:CxxC motif-containing protein
METMEYICIVCPRSCRGELIIEDGRMGFADYRCKRGEKYAANEFTSPTRMLTTTVNVTGAGVKRLPVVSSKEIRKDRLIDCLEYLYGKTFHAPVKEGDKLIENILGTHVDIIAAMDLTYEVRG